MSRRRKTAINVPASLEEATGLLAEYVEIERRMIALYLQSQAQIDEIEAGRDRILASLRTGQEGRFASLKGWWETAGQTLWRDRRSTELVGAKIGIRLAPPKVKFARGTSARGIAAWLKGLRWSRAKEFLRTKTELDKPALIKAVQAEESVREMFAPMGVSVVQEDEFFIDARLDEEALRCELDDGL